MSRKNSHEYEQMESGDYYELDVEKKTDYFHMMCCDCLLVHHMHAEKTKDGLIRIYVYRDDYATKMARNGKRKKK